jgi:putative flippase GtrA
MTLPAITDPRITEFLRFAAVGVVGLFADIAALTLALEILHLDLYSGRVFSYLIAATTTWALNRRFTFTQADQSSPFKQWVKFLGANAIGGVVNYAVYAVIVTFTVVGAAYPQIGVAAGSIAGLFFNFTVNKLWVFKK